MVDKLKKAAAQHSMAAFSLLTAARTLRRAAQELNVAHDILKEDGLREMANAARNAAKKLDQQRRTLTKK